MLVRARTRRTSRSAATARPRCSTRAGEMVMQAEHIPVHLGAMPAAVAAVLGEDHAPGRAVGPQRPLPRRHPPARHHGRHAGVRRRRGELLGFAASRAHHADVGGRVPGSMPADSTTLEEEGVVIAPRVLDDAAIDELAAQMRQPAQRRADLRAQLAANRDRRAAPARARASALGADALREATAAVLDYAERRTRACIAALRRRRRARRATCSRRARATSSCACAATVEGDRADPRLHRQRRAARGQPQLPARRHALGGVLRGARPHRPRHPAERRRLPADRGARARGLAAQRPRRPRRCAGGNVETSSRVADLVLAAFGRALGQGTMNNLTLGNDALHLLRDARRRPGRLPGRRRPERRPRRDVQHAQHAGRGARARVPAARGRVRGAPRLAAAPGVTAAATAWSASSRRWRRWPTR